MATIRLIPSSYSLSNSNYLTVSDASNMYANTDSTNYATITNRQSGTTTYYIYVKGFNFSDIPSNAIVSSFTVKFKAYESGLSTSSSYRPRIVNDTTTLTGGSTAVSASTNTISFTDVTADWNTIKGYGSNFGIRISARRSNKNTTGYLYLYGAEIEVNYTVPVYHSITSYTDSGVVVPYGQTTLLEGSTYELRIYDINNPIVTDNFVDVTSQLIEQTTDTQTAIPDGNTNSNFTLSNIDNAYTDADDDSYATLNLAAGGTGTLYLDLGGISLPSGATIQSVSCQATLRYSRNSSSSGCTASCQLYSGNTAKGSSTSVVTAGGTDVAKTTFNLTIGNWTSSELSNARFYFTATNNAYSTQRIFYIYGVSLNVTYSISGKIYIYIITNVTGDHAIVVTGSQATDTLYMKVNGTWKEVSAVYKKVNGVWELQSDLQNLFDLSIKYIRG